MKRQNLIGKKFGRLTILSPSKSIKEGEIFKTAWNCICECGNSIVAKTYNLNRGGVLSCGCLRDDLRIKLKPNQKFGRLITLSYNGESVWECQCNCGIKCLIKSDKLSLGKTKSCGCLAREQSKKNIKIALKKKKKYKPNISSARRIWQRYCQLDCVSSKNSNISFKDFLKISQNKCYYCNTLPQNNFNLFLFPCYKANQDIIKYGNFTYNKLRKINNNKKYTKDNCVAYCGFCKK